MHTWVEVMAVFAVTHVVGDFILQTEFQAINKHGGLGRDPVARKALALHTFSYTASFLPALIWLGDGLGGFALIATALAIAVPHAVTDDARGVRWWMVHVKHTDPTPGVLSILVDQSFHLVALMVLALIVGV